MFIGYFLPRWDAGEAASRALAQSKVGPSMVRLANAAETLAALRLSGGGRAVAWLERYLAARGCREDKVLLLLGFTGGAAQVEAMQTKVASIVRRHGAVSTGALLGRKWRASRFKSAYLRNALWSAGYAVDTMETAVNWPRVSATMRAIEEAGRDALAKLGEKCHAQTHLSHVYPQGSSVYSTFVFRVSPDFDTTFASWRALKSAVSEAIVREGGTISHQHGVGKDHALYLAAEKGERGSGASGDGRSFRPGRRARFWQFAGVSGRREPEESLARLHDGPPLDVLVVGGGISGASVALECARAEFVPRLSKRATSRAEPRRVRRSWCMAACAISRKATSVHARIRARAH